MDQVHRSPNSIALIFRERDGNLQGATDMHKEQEAISREHNNPYGIALSLDELEGIIQEHPS